MDQAVKITSVKTAATASNCMHVWVKIEADAGMSLSEIFDLFGQAAYRRFERQSLERVLDVHDHAVIETGGGLVSEPSTFERLLASCYTIWLQAAPEEHMSRVAAQGAHRRMDGRGEAMGDLRRILEGRDTLYRKADTIVDTSNRSESDCLDELESIGRRLAAG